MPLGRNNSKKSIGLKPVVKKGEDPRFLVSRYEDGAWKNNVDEGVKSVQGDITEIKIETFEYEGDEKRSAIIRMDDGVDNFRLQVGFGNAARGFFNSLLSLEDFKDVSVSMYLSKTGYAAFGVWQRDELVKWKYNLEDLPQPEETQFKGKTMRDYTEVDLFFEKHLQELTKKIKVSAPTRRASAETESDDYEEDEIPF